MPPNIFPSRHRIVFRGGSCQGGRPPRRLRVNCRSTFLDVSFIASFQPGAQAPLPAALRFFLACSPSPLLLRMIFCSDSQSHHFLQILHLKTHLIPETFPEWKWYPEEESQWGTGKRPSAPDLFALLPLSVARKLPRSYFCPLLFTGPASLTNLPAFLKLFLYP